MIVGACSGISLRQELLTPTALVNAVRLHTVPITAIKVAIIAAVERQQCRIYNSHKKWDYFKREPSNYFTMVNSIDITIRGGHTCFQAAIHYGC
jgi:hypothetical protein